MKLQSELEKLKELYIGNDSGTFERQYLSICENFPTDKEQIDNYMSAVINQSIKETDTFINETKVKIQLLNVAKIVSLSYIAKEYFHKTRAWLYQKINGNKTNGRETRFTPEEIDTLNFALQDISKKIGSTVISL
ncbi:MAG: DUF5053 domain-containing protein [Candidatus Azobacteroides sp.]|nr:DUF5053 domain-containing protein [Candidatus Azobacteroides sp.]